MTEISTLVYSPEVGHDVSCSTPIDYDGNDYSTCEDAAKAFYAALVKYAKEHHGYTDAMVKSEIACWPPERTEQYSKTPQWCVVWEAGPYQWAHSMFIGGSWGHCEPYYSFDLHFCPA